MFRSTAHRLRIWLDRADDEAAPAPRADGWFDWPDRVELPAPERIEVSATAPAARAGSLPRPTAAPAVHPASRDTTEPSRPDAAIFDWESSAAEFVAVATPESPAHLHHPHRRALRWERKRRPGAVPARPGHCISPVGAPADPGHRAAQA